MAVGAKSSSLTEMQENLEALLQSICGEKFYNDAKKFSFRHPFVFVGIVSIGLLSLLPMLYFLGFTIFTLFIALVCFLCIEGSIIAIGGIIFLGIVCFISVIVICIMSCIAIAYTILVQLRMALRSSPFPCMNNSVNITNDDNKLD